MMEARLFSSANWQQQLALLAFMVSGTLIVISYLILGYKQITLPEIIFVYISPWFMIWARFLTDVILSKRYRNEITIIIIIIILGIINVSMSDNSFISFYTMIIFLISGVVPLWTSLFLLKEDNSRTIYYIMCCGLLFIIAIIELVNYFLIGHSWLFLNHPIPVGTLVILLLLGPLSLSVSGQIRVKILGILLIILGLLLIVITNKRGTFLSIAGMALAWIYYRYIRTSFYAIIVLFFGVISILWGLNYYQSLDGNIPRHNSILHRLELYPFALHVYGKHPFFGTGLRAYSHGNYLNDYQIHNKTLDKFSDTVNELQTFDNMFLTAIVELGSLMALCYAFLIVFIVNRYCRNTKPFLLKNKNKFILLLPLLGLTIHSITYDSLVFPQINWLFHVQLGILSGLSSGHCQCSSFHERESLK